MEFNFDYFYLVIIIESGFKFGFKTASRKLTSERNGFEKSQ